MLLLVLFATAYAQRDAQAPAPATASCPGQPAPAPIATGVYTQKPVPDIVINGQAAPGAIWKAGDRSYWHCHTGGQLLMVDSGVGRVQQRGQRARVLRRGETEWAGPGVEHWHGADVNESAHFFQTATVGSQTLWMEEVGRDDYLGNDTGINSRNEFLRTGVRKKN
ncbi:MAG TPA: hypothetical protein VLV86_16280 [Vicinamibacterales bacterium]|nr:hypothetical protein [Vicinamibacterales bacterium]